MSASYSQTIAFERLEVPYLLPSRGGKNKSPGICFVQDVDVGAGVAVGVLQRSNDEQWE